MRNLASSIQVEYEKVSSDRRVCDFETVFPLTGRSVGSRPLRSTSAAGGSGAHGRRRRCASGRTDARAGRLEWSDDERATTRESTDVPCGEFLWDLWVHVRGQMLCFVVVEWSHAWCLLLSCSLTLAAFGPLSTRYGFPSGNSLTAPIDASATVTPVSCEVLLTCCVVHDYISTCTCTNMYPKLVP